MASRCLPCPEIKKRNVSFGRTGPFLFLGFFVPANLHASLDFAFGFSKTGVNKPSDASSERIESLAMPVKKSGGSSFSLFGEKRWNAIK